MQRMAADVDVVIIGAGAAGIAAARRLAASHLSAIVLEATARVGGRAWTCDVAGMQLDLGCGWLHSADRNPWTRIAEGAGFVVDRRAPAWGRQYQEIGFSQTDEAAARRAFAAWQQRMETSPPASDCAADALEPEGEWNAYLQAISGFMNGAGLEQISVADYTAYDAASTGCNWRTPARYGTVIAASLPHPIDLRLATPVQSIELDGPGVELKTPVGAVRARAAILTVSTAVLAGSTIRLRPGLDAWRHAAACLPLGRNEKLFIEIVGESSFTPETRVIGNPREPGRLELTRWRVADLARETILPRESARGQTTSANHKRLFACKPQISRAFHLAQVIGELHDLLKTRLMLE